MGLFTFLNPFTRDSGIEHSGVNGIDTLVHEKIAHYINRPFTLWQRLKKTFSIIAGTHYQFNPLTGKSGNKGLLDFLILPLLSRKLVWSINNHTGSFISYLAKNILNLMVYPPIQIARLVLGLALTIVVSPFIGIAHLIQKSNTNKSKKIVRELDVNTIHEQAVNIGFVATKVEKLGDFLDRTGHSVDELVTLKKAKIGTDTGFKQFRLTSQQRVRMSVSMASNLYTTVSLFKPLEQQSNPEAENAFKAFLKK